MTADSDAIDEHIAPLPPAWRKPTETFLNERFLDVGETPTVPPDNDRCEVLKQAQVQLRRQTIINDKIIREYMVLLQTMEQLEPATFMDPSALQQLLSNKITKNPLWLCQLEPSLGSGPAVDIFWPVHHGDDLGHWSLIHVDTFHRRVTSHDSWSSIGGDRTTEAREVVYEYWTKQRVTATERERWTHVASSWDEHSRVQAANSNDGGILCLLLMRHLRDCWEEPTLCEEAARREDVMRWVGMRMRHRIAAELLAGQIDPPEDAVPDWLVNA